MAFDSQNIIIVGAFNVAIIQPNWLKDQGIYNKQIETTIVPQFGTIQYNLKDEGISFEITQNRIKLSNIDFNEDLTKNQLNFIIEIFKKLEYTPIYVIGYNLKKSTMDDILKEYMLINKENQSNQITFSVSNRVKWNNYIVLKDIEKDITKSITSTSFNFEKKIDGKKPVSHLEDFFKDLEKMREYVLHNNS